jgi:hypothetical protein
MNRIACSARLFNRLDPGRRAVVVGDVVIRDELRPRWEPKVRQALVKAGARAGSIPRDSPDLILIEVVSSKVKESLRPVAA